ncbi:hypothetical protein [Roseateles terrae]|uniref:Flagellar FliJ protein n=1 Tax=Roseateles terrae TaxID=431060 RepID=A0ABR6GPF8_9BURK|nr:hypothetical protein [Roseateles terrae]MBB3193976.1 hypothetical protein [Roseateles terrae]OWQ87851.1 hypothetical protein CDN98_06710 [Roseateles terrae]
MEVTTLQDELAAERRTLSMLGQLVNEQHGHYVELMAQAAAVVSFTDRCRILQKSVEARQYRDSLQGRMDKQDRVVRAIEHRIEEQRIKRVAVLDPLIQLQEIAPAPVTPEAA